MSSSTEQLCGVTGRRQHSDAGWAEREYQAHFLIEIIHFLKGVSEV